MDFRQALTILKNVGQLVTVQTDVSADMEVAAIVDRLCKQSTPPPAVLFNAVVGSRWPVLFNLFGCQQRLERLLVGAEGLSAVERLCLLSSQLSGYADFGRWLASQVWLLPQSLPLPTMLNCGDFSSVPPLKMWPEDAGYALSMAVVISRSLSGEHVNCGLYRVQIHDTRRASLHWRPGSDALRLFGEYQQAKQPMPVVIVLGCAPALTFAASFPLPTAVDEMQMAGFLNHQPLTVASSEIHGLPVPVPCEFVFEGYVDTQQRLTDGPFGNHQGFYSAAVSCPVFHLQRACCQADAIYPATLTGPPPMESCYLGQLAYALLLPLLQREIAQVVDLFTPRAGVFHGCCLIRLRVDAQLSAVKQALCRHPLLARSRLVVFVDEEIDVRNPEQVFWRVINQNYQSAVQMNGQRVMIDATDWVGHGQKTLHCPDEITQRVTARWAEYGLDNPHGQLK